MAITGLSYLESYSSSAAYVFGMLVFLPFPMGVFGGLVSRLLLSLSLAGLTLPLAQVSSTTGASQSFVFGCVVGISLRLILELVGSGLEILEHQAGMLLSQGYDPALGGSTGALRTLGIYGFLAWMIAQGLFDGLWSMHLFYDSVGLTSFAEPVSFFAAQVPAVKFCLLSLAKIAPFFVFAAVLLCALDLFCALLTRTTGAVYVYALSSIRPLFVPLLVSILLSSIIR